MLQSRLIKGKSLAKQSNSGGADATVPKSSSVSVVGLIRSTAQGYNIFGEPQEYQPFAKDLKSFLAKFDTERHIFGNVCSLLLSTVTKQTVSTIGGILTTTNDSTDLLQLEAKLEKYLKDSAKGCKLILSMVNKRLQDIRKETMGFNTISTTKVSNSLHLIMLL